MKIENEDEYEAWKYERLIGSNAARSYQPGQRFYSGWLAILLGGARCYPCTSISSGVEFLNLRSAKRNSLQRLKHGILPAKSHSSQSQKRWRASGTLACSQQVSCLKAAHCRKMHPQKLFLPLQPVRRCSLSLAILPRRQKRHSPRL